MKEQRIEEMATEIVRSIFGAERAGQEYDYVVKALTEAYQAGKKAGIDEVVGKKQKVLPSDFSIEEAYVPLPKTVNKVILRREQDVWQFDIPVVKLNPKEASQDNK